MEHNWHPACLLEEVVYFERVGKDDQPDPVNWLTMGNFFVVVPNSGRSAEAAELFVRGLRNSGARTRIQSDWCCAATIPRCNGSGGNLVHTAKDSSWLLAAGTWFHVDGFGADQESRLLDRYMEVGADQLANELDGFYTIVIGDSRSKLTIVITDIVGSCHAYVRQMSCGTLLSGSSLTLARLGRVELDPIACQEFLHSGIIYEGRTFYKEIRKLPAATITEFHPGGHQIARTYWRIGQLQPDRLDLDKATDQLWESLTTTAATITRQFPQVICDMTGGYDSRAIVAAFLATGAPFSTVVSGREDSPDVRVSRSLSSITQMPHSRFDRLEQVSIADIHRALELTDGECDLVEYASTARVHRQLSAGYDISINGSFGEVARGYWWELLLPRTGSRRPLDYDKVARLRFATGKFDPSLFPPEFRLDLGSHFADAIERTTAGLQHFPNTFQMDAAYLGMRMEHWQGRIASSTNRIWPCLSPFMFRKTLETMLQTEANGRKRSLLIRSMLAQYQPSLAAHPLEHGYPALPATLRTLPRFWPLLPEYGGKIMRKVLQRSGIAKRAETGGETLRIRLWNSEEIRQLLDPETMHLRSILEPTALARFINSSQQPSFEYDLEWRRLLTLEYATRAARGESSS